MDYPLPTHSHPFNPDVITVGGVKAGYYPSKLKLFRPLFIPNIKHFHALRKQSNSKQDLHNQSRPGVTIKNHFEFKLPFIHGRVSCYT